MNNLVGLVGHATFVSDHDDGYSLVVVELLQKVHHLDAGLRIKGAGRFVGKDDLRLGNERTRNGYTLLLSSRHLVGIVVCPLCQAQPVKIFHGHLVAFLSAYALVEQWQFDVFNRRLKRDEVERLEDEPYHLVAVFGCTAFAEVPYWHTIEQVFARVVVVKNA